MITGIGTSRWALGTVEHDEFLYTFSRLACPTADHCVAVGDAGPFTTVDSGATWSTATLPRDIAELPATNAVSCSSPTTCVAVADIGVLMSHDGGRTWTRNTTTTASGQRGIACVATICVIPSATEFLRSADSGQTWAVVSAPAAASFDAVACPSRADCVAVGSSSGSSSSPTVAYSRDGGRSWVAARSANDLLDAVECSSTRDCVAVGVDPAGAGVVARTMDGGATWTPGRLPEGSTYLYDVACPTTNHCVAVSKTQIVFSTDGGATWT